MKSNFQVALPKKKNDLPLLKEVLSKGDFLKLATNMFSVVKESSKKR